MTGGYEMNLIAFLLSQSIDTHRANTRDVKNFIRSHGILGKTDKIDAKWLSVYGYERSSRLKLFQPVDKSFQDLVAFCRRRFDLNKLLVQEKNRHKAQ